MKRISLKHRLVISSLGAVLVLSAAGWRAFSSAEESVYRAGVVSKNVLRAATTATGGALVYPATDHPEVTGLEVVIPPGGQTGWHRHPVPGFAYDGGARRGFKAGEAFAEAVGTAHNGRNEGKIPVRLAVFFLGETGSPTAEKVPPDKDLGRRPSGRRPSD